MRRNRTKWPMLIMVWIFILCMPSVLFTGCSDAIEIDNQVYALVVGVDNGVTNKIRMTIQYPTYKGSGGGGGSGMQKGGGGGDEGDTGAVEGTIVNVVEASSILEGLDLLNTSIPRRISLTHIKVLAFSEAYAKNGVDDTVAAMTRFRDTRRNMRVFVCKGNAEDFIKESKSPIGDSLSKSIDLLLSQSEHTGFFPDVSLHEFYKKILSPYENAYAAYVGLNNYKNLQEKPGASSATLKEEPSIAPGEIPRTGGSKWEIAGTAVFKADKMVGVLDNYETRYFLLATGAFKSGNLTIQDPKQPGLPISFDLREGRKPKTSGKFVNGKPVVALKLNIEADMGSIPSRIQYEKVNMIEILNNQIKSHLEAGIIKTVDKATKELKADIFGFGHKFSDDFSTIQEWEKYNWQSHYPDTKLNLSMDVNIRRSGLMFGSTQIWNAGS